MSTPGVRDTGRTAAYRAEDTWGAKMADAGHFAAGHLAGADRPAFGPFYEAAGHNYRVANADHEAVLKAQRGVAANRIRAAVTAIVSHEWWLAAAGWNRIDVRVRWAGSCSAGHSDLNMTPTARAWILLHEMAHIIVNRHVSHPRGVAGAPEHYIWVDGGHGVIWRRVYVDLTWLVLGEGWATGLEQAFTDARLAVAAWSDFAPLLDPRRFALDGDLQPAFWKAIDPDGFRASQPAPVRRAAKILPLGPTVQGRLFC